MPCNDSFKPPRRRGVRPAGCGGPAPSGAGAGATRVRKRSRARARDRRIPVRAVRARVTSDCDLTAIGRRSCTEIGRGILKFCCQCEENFRSVHTYITNCCSRLLLLFCCYCSTLQHCFPLNVSELERSGRCSRASTLDRLRLDGGRGTRSVSQRISRPVAPSSRGKDFSGALCYRVAYRAAPRPRHDLIEQHCN